jgi:hypothetical protein
MAALIACVGSVAVWNWKAPSTVARRLEKILGRRVSVRSVGVTWRLQVVARDIEIAGAPPFESQSVVHVDRAVLSLRGSAGVFSPSAIFIDGADIDYLATANGDNVRGVAAERGRTRSGSQRQDKTGLPNVTLRHGRLRGTLALPHLPHVAVRAPEIEAFRDAKGQLEIDLHRLVVETDGIATVRSTAVAVQSGHGRPLHVSATGLAVEVPGGGALVDNLVFDGEGSSSASSFELHSKESAEPSIAVTASWTLQSGEITAKVHGLPLRGFASIAGGRAFGLENSKAQLQAHVTVDRVALRSDFQFDGRVTALDILHPAIDTAPWRNQSAWFYAHGQADLTTGKLEVQEASFKAFGALVKMNGFVENWRTPRGTIALFTPPHEPLSCPALLFGQPAPVQQALAGLNLQGNLGFKVALTFDSASWQDLDLDVEVGPMCTVQREARALAELLPVLRSPKTQSPPPGFKEPLGPSHPDFVPLIRMPPHLPSAFITSEDGKFFHHQGFDTDMIRHALAQDLGNRSFDRGASTITQQLAKNLFLTHRRTLARKLEEAVLTWRLQKLLSKDRVLELYLNVIELGPGIRGVKQAARRYFGKDVEDLTPMESAHLAALTPNPHVLARRFRDGEVDEGWQQRLYDLLGMMKRHRRLSAEDLAAARASKLELRDLGRDGSGEAVADRPN